MGDSRHWAEEKHERDRRAALQPKFNAFTIEHFAKLEEELRWLRNWQSEHPLTKSARDRIMGICSILNYKTGKDE